MPAQKQPGSDTTRVRVSTQSGSPPLPSRYRASVAILSGYAEGMEYPVTKTCTTIGRDATSDIMVRDPLASRCHASILFENGKFLLKDMGSTNGTLFRGRPITQEELRNTDRFMIGDTTLQFIVEDSGEGKVFEIR